MVSWGVVATAMALVEGTTSCIGFWMPQVIQTFGLDPLAIGFLTAIPYAFAAKAGSDMTRDVVLLWRFDLR
jgi:hypothetical protein